MVQLAREVPAKTWKRVNYKNLFGPLVERVEKCVIEELGAVLLEKVEDGDLICSLVSSNVGGAAAMMCAQKKLGSSELSSEEVRQIACAVARSMAPGDVEDFLRAIHDPEVRLLAQDDVFRVTKRPLCERLVALSRCGLRGHDVDDLSLRLARQTLSELDHWGKEDRRCVSEFLAEVLPPAELLVHAGRYGDGDLPRIVSA